MIAGAGLEMSYDVEGSGPAMVFLHGWGVDRRVWRQQVKHFSSENKVITLDLPGHGESPWQEANLKDIALGVIAVLDKENVSDAVLVGSSLGGMVAIQCAALATERIGRLVMVGSLPKLAKSSEYPYGLDVAQFRKLAGQLETAYPDIMTVFFRSLFTKWERATRRYHWIQRFRRDISQPRAEALLAYLDILENTDLITTLGTIKMPLQVMLGSHDPICGASAETFLRAIVPQAQFYIFQQCGHFPFLSQPHGFNKMLDDFLSESR